MNVLKKNKLKLDELLYEWLVNKKNIKIQTFQKYEHLINKYLINTLGQVKVKEISEKIILNFFINLENQEISTSICKTLLYIIKSVLKEAENRNLCKHIDLENIKFQKYIPKVNILCKDDQTRLEKYLKNDINIRKICILLCLYTGLRIGEVCGLKWEDIDFQNKNLKVKRTIQRIKNKNQTDLTKTILIASTPKSESSTRVVPIPDFIIELLKIYKNKNDFYILSNNEKYYDPRLFEYFYVRVLKKCQIKYINFHALRHTFATRAIESQMDIKTLSEILGHASVDITLKIYVHSSFELKKKCIENLVEFMSH